MAKQIDEGMAHAVKGLSFFDWDGLNNDEYDKLSGIINTPNKSSGVELLFEDEQSSEMNNKTEVGEEEIIENVSENVETSVEVKREEQVVTLESEGQKQEIQEKFEEKGIEAPISDGKQIVEKVIVDVENSVLQPSAPVFQPSIPPPSIMPFPIAVPHWAPHHQHHADPTMPHPAHHHPHHHQPQAGPYSYAVPGGYVFHPHDPSLTAAAHHHTHGHAGEPTTVPCFVTLSNGHQPHQSVYAYPSHHHIPAHYPYQSNTLAAASGLPSPLPHAAAAAHHQPQHHHQSHHHRHHLPSQTDILHSISANAVIPNTSPHHHPMGYPHIASVTTAGQQPLPAHMVPPNTMSHRQPTTMPHQHHFDQQLHHHQSTQFMYISHEQHQQPSASIPPSHTPEEHGGNARLCANSSNNNETSDETLTDHSQNGKEEAQSQDFENCNQSKVSEDKIETAETEDSNEAVANEDNQCSLTSEDKASPSKLTLAEIEFGGPVVFDTVPQNVSNSLPVEKTSTKSPMAGKTKTKQVPSSSSPSVQHTKSSSSTPKKDKASFSSKHKAGPVIEIGNIIPVSQAVKNNVKKEESNLTTHHSSNTNAKKQSSRVNKETTTSKNVSSPSTSSSSSQPILSSKKASTSKTNHPSSDVNLLQSVNSSVAKEKLKSTEASECSKPLCNEEAKSDIDPSKKPQILVSKPVASAAPAAPKSWSSLFGKQAPNAPSQPPPSNVTLEQPVVANNVESPQTGSSSVQPPVTSVRHLQEQERHMGKEKATLSSVDSIKAVGVKQDPLAPKLLAKLSNFPISYIPIIVQPRGLTNGRNICFMNATLQVLMGCPPFIHLFRAFRNLPARTGGKSSTPIFDSLVQFVNSFQHCQRTKQQGSVKKGSGYAINQGAPFIPESLLGVAQHILGLNIGVQHDAEEFLSQILSICNEEVERIIKMNNNMDSLNNNAAPMSKKNVIGNGSHYQNGDLNNHADEDANDDDGDGSWVQVGPKNYCVETNVNNCGQTPLSAIFAGLSRSTLVRDSGKTSDTVDSFFTLKLDIQADSVHSLRDALVRLNATEDVHDVDGTKVKGHRRMFFDELPPVLIMHLKLFRYSNGVGQKIQKNISFDVHLQIPKEMMSRFGKPKYQPLKSRSYKLFGVVNHHGTKMDDGHYTSDVFLPIVNGWLHFDDTKVSVTEEATVLKHVEKSMPYLLFYRRVDV